MTFFSFSNPDGTIRVVDLQQVFPAGSDSSRIREYGIELAKEYEPVCIRIADEFAELARSVGSCAEELLPAGAVAERIGIMLGQQIHYHLLHGELNADIWQEVVHLLYSRIGRVGPKIHFFFL